jgi:hypothetical protein
MAKVVLQVGVQHGGTGVEEGLHCRPAPTHLLSCPFSRLLEAEIHRLISLVQACTVKGGS